MDYFTNMLQERIKNKVLSNDQRIQVEGNFPLLFGASLELLEVIKNRNIEKVLFCSRDCFLWHKLFKALTDKLDIDIDFEYMMSSSTMSINPSDDYTKYFKSKLINGKTLIVDIRGTKSLAHLIETTQVNNVELFFISYITVEGGFREYAKKLQLKNITPVNHIQCFFNGWLEKDESLNTELVPSTLDIFKTGNSYDQMFEAKDFDTETRYQINEQQDAFLNMISLIYSLDKDEILNIHESTRINIMMAAHLIISNIEIRDYTYHYF